MAPRQLTRVAILTAPRRAGGVERAATTQVRAGGTQTITWKLTGDDEATVTLVASDPLCDQAVALPRSFVELTTSDGTTEEVFEGRLVREERGHAARDVPTVTWTVAGMLVDLSDAGILGERDALTGLPDLSGAFTNATAGEFWEARIAPVLERAALPYTWALDVLDDPDQRYDWGWSWQGSHETLRATLRGDSSARRELRVVPTATGFALQLARQTGSDAAPVTLAPAKAIAELRRTYDTSEQATVVAPKGANDRTMAQTRWEVSAVDSGTRTLTLVDPAGEVPPVVTADAWNGKALRRVVSGRSHTILDSAPGAGVTATATFALSEWPDGVTAPSWAVGERVELRDTAPVIDSTTRAALLARADLRTTLGHTAALSYAASQPSVYNPAANVTAGAAPGGAPINTTIASVAGSVLTLTAGAFLKLDPATGGVIGPATVADLLGTDPAALRGWLLTTLRPVTTVGADKWKVLDRNTNSITFATAWWDADVEVGDVLTLDDGQTGFNAAIVTDIDTSTGYDVTVRLAPYWPTLSVVGANAQELFGGPAYYAGFVVLRPTSVLTTITGVNASGGTLTVASAAGIVAGDRPVILRPPAGEATVSVEDPAAVAAYGRVERVLDASEAVDPLANDVPNGIMGTFPIGATLPANWRNSSPSNYATFQTLSRSTERTRYGAAALKVTPAVAGQPVLAVIDSPIARPLRATGTEAVSARVALWFTRRPTLAVLELLDVTATSAGHVVARVQMDPAAPLATGTWVELALNGVTLPPWTRDLRVRVRWSSLGAAYLDAVSLQLATAANTRFVEGSDANVLTGLAQLALAERSDPWLVGSDFEARINDFARLDGSEPALTLGGPVIVSAPDAGLPAATLRVVELTVDLRDADRTAVRIARRASRLTEMLADLRGTTTILNVTNAGTATDTGTGSGGSGDDGDDGDGGSSGGGGTSGALTPRQFLTVAPGTRAVLPAFDDAVTELDPGWRVWVDLTNAATARLQGWVETAGPADSALVVQCRPDAADDWTPLDGAASAAVAGPALSLADIGSQLGAPVAIGTDARRFVQLSVFTRGGDGVTRPELGNLVLELDATAATPDTGNPDAPVPPPPPSYCSTASGFITIYCEDLTQYADTAALQATIRYPSGEYIFAGEGWRFATRLTDPVATPRWPDLNLLTDASGRRFLRHRATSATPQTVLFLTPNMALEAPRTYGAWFTYRVRPTFSAPMTGGAERYLGLRVLNDDQERFAFGWRADGTYELRDLVAGTSTTFVAPGGSQPEVSAGTFVDFALRFVPDSGGTLVHVHRRIPSAGVWVPLNPGGAAFPTAWSIEPTEGDFNGLRFGTRAGLSDGGSVRCGVDLQRLRAFGVRLNPTEIDPVGIP